MNDSILDTRKPIILKVVHYKAGYEVRTEKHFPGNGETLIMKNAYTLSGDWIGDSTLAYRLIVKHGIQPEKADPSHNICSIGFCKKETKWYGWSHRARFGFGIGSKVEEGDCLASSGFTNADLAEHPEEDRRLPVGFVAKTLDDAKKMAIAFADSVS